MTQRLAASAPDAALTGTGETPGASAPNLAAGDAGRSPGLGATVDAALVRELTARLGSAVEARWVLEDAPDAAAARALAARRAAGEPLQYLLGHWAFRYLDLVVDPRVLIPRPETEQVVEVALGLLADRVREAGPAGPAPVAVDLGTGSGAIALALATESQPVAPPGRESTQPGVGLGPHVPEEGGVGAPPGQEISVWATDVSAETLAMTRANVARVDAVCPGAAARVTLAQGDWWGALPEHLAGQVDLVVANPPYVAASEWPRLDPAVRDYEPHRALVAPDGSDGTPGLADVEAVLSGAARWLAPGGWVVVELSPHQAPAALAVARRAGLVDGRVAPDLAGRDRMVIAGRSR